MELAPYVLPPSLDFAQRLKSTLTFGFRQTIPEYGAELFDHFEIEIAEPITIKRGGTDASHVSSRRSKRSEVSYSPVKGDDGAKGNDSNASPTKRLMEKRNERQRAYFASLAEDEQASGKAGDDESSTVAGSLSTANSRSGGAREKDDAVLFPNVRKPGVVRDQSRGVTESVPEGIRARELRRESLQLEAVEHRVAVLGGAAQAGAAGGK